MIIKIPDADLDERLNYYGIDEDTTSDGRPVKITGVIEA